MDAGSKFALAALFGSLFHILIARHGEIERYLLSLIFTFFSTSGLCFSFFRFYLSQSLLHSLRNATALHAAFLAGLLASIVIYRLFFHPLRHFPGHWTARISRLYASYIVARNAKMHYAVQAMHAAFGDVVRVGPREISINHASAIKAIYGPPSRCSKGPWYDQATLDDSKKALLTLRDVKTHNIRRRVWDRGVRTQALEEYQPRMTAKTKLLVSQIGAQAQPVNITNWISCYSFDVMGDVALGIQFGMLKDGKKHPAIKRLHETTQVVAIAGTIPWFASLVRDIPGFSELTNPFRHLCHSLLDQRRSTLEKDQVPTDIISWLIQAFNTGDRGASPSETALKDDAWVLTVAGSDTALTVIVNALFYLSIHPSALTKLQSELDHVFPNGIQDWSPERLKETKYLDYVINETLRLKPSVPGGLARVTPPQGLQVDDDIYIPGNTIVSVPTFTIHRDERYFTNAAEFIPERWEKIGADGGASVPFIPFSKGSFDCVGKSIAWMELRDAISMITLEYDIKLSDESQRAFDGKESDNFTLAVPDLFMAFSRRH